MGVVTPGVVYLVGEAPRDTGLLSLTTVEGKVHLRHLRKLGNRAVAACNTDMYYGYSSTDNILKIFW